MRPILTVLVLCAAVLFCTASTCHPGPVLADLGQCEKSAAAKDAPALVPIVIAIRSTASLDAAADAALLGLAVKFGFDSLDCAVQGAVEALKQLAAVPTSQPGTLKAAMMPVPVARGQRWLATRGAGKRTVAP